MTKTVLKKGDYFHSQFTGAVHGRLFPFTFHGCSPWEIISTPSSQVLSVVAEKSWQQDPEVADHIDSTVRKQRGKHYIQFSAFLVFIPSKIPAHRVTLPRRWVFLPQPTQENPSQNADICFHGDSKPHQDDSQD